jgi:hypothetical protein
MSGLFEDYDKYPQLTAAQRRWWDEKYNGPVSEVQSLIEPLKNVEEVRAVIRWAAPVTLLVVLKTEGLVAEPGRYGNTKVSLPPHRAHKALRQIIKNGSNYYVRDSMEKIRDALNREGVLSFLHEFYLEIQYENGVEFKVLPVVTANGARYLPTGEYQWSHDFFATEFELVGHALKRKLLHLLHAVGVRFRIDFDFKNFVNQLYDHKLEVVPSKDDKTNIVTMLYTASRTTIDKQLLLQMACLELQFTTYGLDQLLVMPPQPPAYRNESGAVISTRTAVDLSATKSGCTLSCQQIVNALNDVWPNKMHHWQVANSTTAYLIHGPGEEWRHHIPKAENNLAQQAIVIKFV